MAKIRSISSTITDIKKTDYEALENRGVNQIHLQLKNHEFPFRNTTTYANCDYYIQTYLQALENTNIKLNVYTAAFKDTETPYIRFYPYDESHTQDMCEGIEYIMSEYDLEGFGFGDYSYPSVYYEKGNVTQQDELVDFAKTIHECVNNSRRGAQFFCYTSYEDYRNAMLSRLAPEMDYIMPEIYSMHGFTPEWFHARLHEYIPRVAGSKSVCTLVTFVEDGTYEKKSRDSVEADIKTVLDHNEFSGYSLFVWYHCVKNIRFYRSAHEACKRRYNLFFNGMVL